MNLQIILQELESLGTERTKKIYIQNGAHEPLFGVASGALKPMAKKIKKNQALAEELYLTGNYDAMYLAGMIAEPKAMSESNFDDWMEKAYFYMISDYIVSVTLAETELNFARSVSDKWIATDKELYISAGYSCYSWLIGNRKDEAFSTEKLNNMLETVGETIHSQANRAKYSMNNFVISVAISYIPLHEKAVSVANAIGKLDDSAGKVKCNIPIASDYIQRAVDRGQIGFKRKNVRC